MASASKGISFTSNKIGNHNHSKCSKTKTIDRLVLPCHAVLKQGKAKDVKNKHVAIPNNKTAICRSSPLLYLFTLLLSFLSATLPTEQKPL